MREFYKGEGISDMFIENTILYMLEVIKLILMSVFFWDADFRVNKRNVTWIALPWIIFLFTILVCGDSARVVITLPFLFFSVYKVLQIKFFYVFLSWNLVTLIDSIVGKVCELYIIDFKADIFEYAIMTNGVLLLLLFLGVYIKKRSRWSGHFYKMSQGMSVALSIEAITVGMLLTVVSSYGFTNMELRIRQIANLVIIVLGIFVCVSMVAYMSLATKNMRLNAEMEMKEVIMSQQERYYVTMLEKDESARRFRHDIRGHMSSIRGYLACKDYDNLNEYIADMDHKLQELSVKIPTGNHVVNAIVSDITSQYENAIIQWNGQLSNEMNIKMMDICTIFYNLLNNACREVNEQDDKRVNVTIKYFEPAVIIEVSNHTDNEVIIDNNYFVQKKFENGHGYGLKNVKECVEKNGGDFEIACSNNTFSAKIVLQNVLA